MSPSLLPIKVANTSFINICNKLPHRLPKMQDQKSFMLHWCSFSGWDREPESVHFDYKASHTSRKMMMYQCQYCAINSMIPGFNIKEKILQHTTAHWNRWGLLQPEQPMGRRVWVPDWPIQKEWVRCLDWLAWTEPHHFRGSNPDCW